MLLRSKLGLLPDMALNPRSPWPLSMLPAIAICGKLTAAFRYNVRSCYSALVVGANRVFRYFKFIQFIYLSNRTTTYEPAFLSCPSFLFPFFSTTLSSYSHTYHHHTQLQCLHSSQLSPPPPRQTLELTSFAGMLGLAPPLRPLHLSLSALGLVSRDLVHGLKIYRAILVAAPHQRLYLNSHSFLLLH